MTAPMPDAGLRVIVADDDPDINRLVRTRLNARGYRTQGAGNGIEALRLIEEEPPDLLFLDISMPQLGGLEVLDHVRSSGADLATIMMTAFGSEDLAVEALRRGATDYLRKPFETIEFESVLKRVTARLLLERQVAGLREEVDEKRRLLEREFERAARLQRELLPRRSPNLSGFELAAHCIAARQVSGDFYDWQEIEGDRLTLVLGDVMGKGMSAALLMATVRASLRAVVRGSQPEEAMRYVVPALRDDLARTEGFVTFFLAQLDSESATLKYVDAGHGHAFVYRAGGSPEPLEPRNLPVGMFPDVGYEGGEAKLSPGDALVVYSDGVIDAEPNLTPQTLAGRLNGAGSAQEMVERLCALASSASSLEDDVTALVVLRTV
jgi:phosphoserine phosphatase RsbU/P